ncbi:MAG: helix-turn-helix domain-containing protein [Thermoleophilia bacterium]
MDSEERIKQSASAAMCSRSVETECLRRGPTCSVEEAAIVLGIGRSTAYAAARDGSLPTLRMSKRILVPTAKLIAMLGVEDDE